MARQATSTAQRFSAASSPRSLLGFNHESNNNNAKSIEKSKSSCINGASKLHAGVRGFLIILDRGVDKSSKVNELCDIFEKFPPDSFDVSGKGISSQPSSSETETLIKGNWDLNSTTGKVGGHEEALHQRPNLEIGGEVLGDGEHNVTDLNSTRQLEKPKCTAQKTDAQRENSQLTKLSSSSLKHEMETDEHNQNEFKGALSSLRKPGEAEDDFIKRIVHEEMEKYLSEDGLLGKSDSLKCSGSVELCDSSPDNSSSSCYSPRDENEFSDAVFLPKLTSKPNAIKRLELKPIVDPKTRRT